MSKWKTVKLGDIGNFQSGGTPSRKNPEYFNGSIPWITTVSLNGAYLDNGSAIEFLTEDGISSSATKIVPAKSIMIGTRVGIGKVAINTVPMCTNQDIISIVGIDEKIWSKKYIVKQLTSFDLFFKSQARGATIQGIKLETLKNVLISLPPLEEQKRIADILDKASNLIDLRKQQLEKMDLLIKSKFIDMFGDPVINPKGWDMKRISDVCIINPRKTELGSITDDLEVSFIPMASVSEKGDIRTNEIKKYSEVKSGFTYFYEGDVLFAKITPCMENGKGAIAKNLKNLIGFGSTEFHVIRPIENITNSEWVFNLLGFKWLREDAEKNMTGSAGQRRVPASYFEKCKASVPPIELQNQFAVFIEQVEKQKAVMQQSLEKMETNYKALMQEYFG